MQFVQPDTTRIALNGSGEWIEVKTELTVAEHEWMISAGYRRQAGEVVVDWVMLKLAPVIVYLVDWSAKVPVSEAAIRTLSRDSFDEIAAAIQAHTAAREDEKKTRSGAGAATTAPSAS